MFCVQRCANDLADDCLTEEFVLAFTNYEVSLHETERARAIFKYALERLPKSQAGDIYQKYTNFEKQFGNREGRNPKVGFVARSDC